MTALRDRLAALLDSRAETPALRLEATTYTWGELREVAHRLFRVADAATQTPARRIALVSADPLLTAAALLGALLGERTLILLHPRLTAAEREAQLVASAADLLVADSPIGAPIPTCAVDREVLLRGAAPEPVKASSGAPLLLLFTSGTTGQPKGAMLSLEALWAAAAASSEKLATGPSDRWLACMPLAHIGGLSILLRGLHDGLLVVAQPRFHAGAVATALHSDAITRLSLVPTMLRDLLDAGATPPPSLRTLLLGGAAAPPDLVRRAVAAGWPVATTYGLTEAAAQVTTATTAQTASSPEASGCPLPGYRLRITDAAVDGVGQIEVASPSLMAGYFNQPAATAERLADGWLRTGDLGFLRADGQLVVVARRVDLIVSGGENIYPAEVEAAICSVLPYPVEACVVGSPSDRWGQEVAALVVLPPDRTLTLADLRAALADRLAPFKLPRHLRIVEALPRTAAGKLDRAAARALIEAPPPQT